MRCSERIDLMHHELVRRAQDGDREAFGVLVQNVIARLYASARLILRDADRAQDAVQDALIEAWRDLPGLRDPDRLDAWLHRLLVRSCYRLARRDRRRQVIEIPLTFDHDAPSFDRLEGVGLRDELDRALARLSPEQRTILVLAYYADLSLADVSAALGIPIGTTKSRVRRAADALRAALAADQRTTALTSGRIA
jgi:RNA polymerase sigma-70 factor (ECF subfamily)